MMLTATAVEKARAKEKRYFLTDQNGLALQVTPTGQKTWVLRIQNDGKDRKVTLGRYPAMSLQHARIEADDRRGRAESGQALKLDSFGDMGEAYISERCLHQIPEHQYCL